MKFSRNLGIQNRDGTRIIKSGTCRHVAWTSQFAPMKTTSILSQTIHIAILARSSCYSKAGVIHFTITHPRYYLPSFRGSKNVYMIRHYRMKYFSAITLVSCMHLQNGNPPSDKLIKQRHPAKTASVSCSTVAAIFTHPSNDTRTHFSVFIPVKICMVNSPVK